MQKFEYLCIDGINPVFCNFLIKDRTSAVILSENTRLFRVINMLNINVVLLSAQIKCYLYLTSF